jgi:hypothetical protein
MLEYPEEAADNFLESYLKISGKRHIELYRLFFEHGVDTLLTPLVGPDIFQRGEAYQPVLEAGLLWFDNDPAFIDFCNEYKVQVRFYGDLNGCLNTPSLRHVLDAYRSLEKQTSSYEPAYRLFIGICANNATESVARISVNFYSEQQRVPNRREIVESYYGEYISPVSFFIGFDRPSVFDMPLISTGAEDLYFTVSPSLYLDRKVLRSILYDHLFSRQLSDNSYASISAKDWEDMKRLYDQNRTSVIGVGRQHNSGKFWYPLPQIVLPPQLEED